MKPDRRPAKKKSSLETTPKSEVQISSAPAGRRKWGFRLLALIGVPLLCLGGVELVLRMAHVGYSTSFFLPDRIQNRDVFVQNDQFSRRFFPKQLVRRPLPLVLNAVKPERTYRIFVFGESAAMGDPEPSFSFSRILEVLLRERFPGSRFEVVNVAFTAINSHVILPIARDCSRQKGDLWVIYMGNNEVAGPFGPATVFGQANPNLNLIRASLAAKKLRLGQSWEELRERLTSRTSASNSWKGLQMFVQNRLAADDSRLKNVYAHFEANLKDILREGRKSGAKIIVSTVASNLKDCAPFASAHSKQLDPAEESTWDNEFQEGIRLEEAGKFSEAVQRYSAAAKIDSAYAELQFRLGRCYLAQTNYATARKCFERALDLDTLRFRADSRLNEILTKSAQNPNSGELVSVDIREVLAKHSPIPGDEFFFDHVHFNFEGNYLVARTIAEETAKLLPEAMKTRDAAQWASSDDCARRLAFTGWNQYQVFESMQRRLREVPFTNQVSHALRQQRYREKLESLKRQLEPKTLDDAVRIYRDALAANSNDAYLHENLVKLLHARGELDEAVGEATAVIQLMPHNAAGHYALGYLLNSQGKHEEAERSFRQALERRPDFADAYYGLGQISAKREIWNQATDFLSKALAVKPDYPEALVALGQVWQKRGQPEKARECLLRVVADHPEAYSIRLHLGNLLTEQKDLLEANKHFAEAVRLQPETVMAHFEKEVRANPQNALAHFQFANALAAQNKMAEALNSLAEAIRLNPDFWEARYLLGIEFATQGKLAEAQNQFSAVVRLRPSFVRAHLNLGVALAKQSRFAEAVAEFREVLRIEPTNNVAQKYLQSLQPAAR